jgi:hypothetical protein
MMTDCNGLRIARGDRVMLVRREDRGRILTVRALIDGACGRKGWACRADDAASDEKSKDNDFTLSSWLWPEDIAKIP